MKISSLSGPVRCTLLKLMKDMYKWKMNFLNRKEKISIEKCRNKMTIRKIHGMK